MKNGTGTLGRPWVELESPRPSRVADRYLYWGDPPPAISERCAYWLRQIERGWLPSRRIRRESYDTSAEWYGIYIWEFINLISPSVSVRLSENDESRPQPEVG